MLEKIKEFFDETFDKKTQMMLFIVLGVVAVLTISIALFTTIEILSAVVLGISAGLLVVLGFYIVKKIEEQ